MERWLAKFEQTLAELAQQHDMHPNQITAWKAQVMEGVAGLFGSGAADTAAAPAKSAQHSWDSSLLNFAVIGR